MIRTIFGNTDDTPRAKQERKDLLWIILSCSHRKLRLENQHKLLLSAQENSIDRHPIT